jgi:hypothetical protein
MIYSAIVKQAGLVEGQWIVTPQYTRIDGTPAPELTALAANGIKPANNDMVLCAESINSFDHGTSRIFDDNAGACPLIIATFEQLLTLLVKLTLGTGTDFMLLGDTTKTQLQKIVDQLTQLKSDFSTWTPVPNDGGAALKTKIAAGFNTKPSADLSQILSQNHKLD